MAAAKYPGTRLKTNRGLVDPLALVVHVVDEDVLPETVGGGVEGAAAVDLRHLVHEVGQVAAALHHERIDRDVFAGTPADLARRLLEAAVSGGVRELGRPLVGRVVRA